MEHIFASIFLFVLRVDWAIASPVSDAAHDIRMGPVPSTFAPTATPINRPDWLDTGVLLNATSSQHIPGVNCTTEGIYHCLGNGTFQQCRYGNWSIVGGLRVEETCNFHGETGKMFPTPPGLLVKFVRVHIRRVFSHYLRNQFAPSAIPLASIFYLQRTLLTTKPYRRSTS